MGECDKDKDGQRTVFQLLRDRDLISVNNCLSLISAVSLIFCPLFYCRLP